jgi:hypothetical protein
MAVASAVAQLSVAVGFENNPDLARETLEGMQPGRIVFHAAKDDAAGNELFVRLSELFSLKRSYDLPVSPDYQIPPGGYSHTVWLQFGDHVTWNGE